MAPRKSGKPDHQDDKSPIEEPQQGQELEDEQEDDEEHENDTENKPSDDSNPPLPDEAPPLPDEEPPLPDEAPPLPNEQPPLPSEAPPLPNEQPPDDGWDPVWDATANAFYFYNRITQATQWENPRLSTLPAPPGLATHDRSSEDPASAPVQKKQRVGGYNPAIHGDYDPTADYAQEDDDSDDEQQGPLVANADGSYEAAGAFNRFTGRWQAAEINPDNHNDENKSKRQMNAFFDVEAAANSHDGRSLKAERQSKKFSKKEIKAFKEKRRERKEEKRRAWLRD